MPFCPKCGKEVEESTAFCPFCGTDLKEEKKVVAKKGGIDPRTCLLISTATIGALGLIALIMRDVLGFIIAAGACAALYFWGIKKLDEKNTNTAQLTALIVGIVVAVIGLVTLFSGGRASFLGILDIAAVVPAFMAWNMLRIQT